MTDWQSMSASLRPYALLLELFRKGSMTPAELEVLYFPLYKSDRTVWDEDSFNILNEFFLDLDEYDPDALPDDDPPTIDEQELRSRAMSALEALIALAERRD